MLFRPRFLFRGFSILGGGYLALYALSHIPSDAIGGFIILALLLGGAVLIAPRILAIQRVARARQHVTEEITRAVSQHSLALMRKRAQLLQPDAYGTLQTDRWNKEIGHFLLTQVAPGLDERDTVMLNGQIVEWCTLVESLTCEAKGDNAAFGKFSSDMKPAEYEAFCAEELQQIGWNAHVTKIGRDQGVDVVAQKNGIRLVLQCKLYSQPVGNKAVQEVVAARAHEHAHFGAVVTNNRYTTAAQQLAATNSVALLHHSDLRNIDILISHAMDRSPRSAGQRAVQGQR